MTTAVLLPILIPSRLRINSAIPEPPTMEGVRAEANSQSIIVSNDFLQERALSVSTRMRYIYPRSRATTQTNAIKNQKAECQVQVIFPSTSLYVTLMYFLPGCSTN